MISLTESEARTRQDPRNGKNAPVGPDKVFPTTRTTPPRKDPMRPRRRTKSGFPEQQELPRYPRTSPRDRTVEPWTLRPTPNPGNPKIVENPKVWTLSSNPIL